jgi:hypothetical protein
MTAAGEQVAPETLVPQWIRQFAQVDKLPLDLSKLPIKLHRFILFIP